MDFKLCNTMYNVNVHNGNCNLHEFKLLTADLFNEQENI